MTRRRIQDPGPQLPRRRFVQGVVGMGALGGLGAWPGRAAAAEGAARTLSGDRFALEIGEIPVNITGRARLATAVNGCMPAPVLRFRQGDMVTIDVTNRLDAPTSLHWHGLRLPAAMDGVPGLTYRGILPGETFTYRFPVTQTGTYWYHSHSGMQEQTGLYGALILAPRHDASGGFDREHVIMLSDWTDEDPMAILSNLKQDGDYYNPRRPSLASLAAEARAMGAGPALDQRLMWSRMRMSQTDIMDVTGLTYRFLVNGQPPPANWTALFTPGERVLLRVINGSSMTTFDVRIPGLMLTVVAADGSAIAPVSVDEFRIGVAETYDILVTPTADAAYTLFAQAEDRSGYARATLAPRAGMEGAVPPLDPPPLRTMADMGMRMDGMRMDATAMQPMAAPARPVAMAPMPDMGGMDMGKMTMPGMNGMAPSAAPTVVNADGVTAASLEGRPAVDNVAAHTADRLAEPGDGLGNNGRRVLTYADLKSRTPNPAAAAPARDIVFHLTGNMARWVWGFDGRTFSEAEPVRIALNERVRFVLINDTMMEHPIHLHGFLFELENGQDGQLPLKHTVNIKPGARTGFVFTADTIGHWAFHCHLLYHMEAGMFRTVIVA